MWLILYTFKGIFIHLREFIHMSVQQRVVSNQESWVNLPTCVSNLNTGQQGCLQPERRGGAPQRKWRKMRFRPKVFQFLLYIIDKCICPSPAGHKNRLQNEHLGSGIKVVIENESNQLMVLCNEVFRHVKSKTDIRWSETFLPRMAHGGTILSCTYYPIISTMNQGVFKLVMCFIVINSGQLFCFIMLRFIVIFMWY